MLDGGEKDCGSEGDRSMTMPRGDELGEWREDGIREREGRRKEVRKRSGCAEVEEKTRTRRGKGQG